MAREAETTSAQSRVQGRHVPVLHAEVLEALAPKDGQTFIDGTFGRGGTTRALLEAANCRVLAIDQDPTAIAVADELAQEFAGRLTPVLGRFGDLQRLVGAAGVALIDGVVLDLGVSSPQLDEAQRGFSFQADGPLDMRMGVEGPSLADLIATVEETELADILYQLGDERRSRAIARAIVKARSLTPITRTLQLALLVERVLGRSKAKGHHPATRTFQALRLWVNDELGELERGLVQALELLKPGGILAVITFHSLEDRIVKRFMGLQAGKQAGASRFQPDVEAAPEPSLRIVNQRPVGPSEAEIARNPRARSAKLRVAERTCGQPLVVNREALGLPELAIKGLG